MFYVCPVAYFDVTVVNHPDPFLCPLFWVMVLKLRYKLKRQKESTLCDICHPQLGAQCHKSRHILAKQHPYGEAALLNVSLGSV